MAIAQSPYPPDVDAHLWRAYRHIEGRLKIGLMLPRTDRAPLWVARILNLLIAETSVKLDVVYRLNGFIEPPSSPSGLLKPLWRWSEKQAAPLAEVPIATKPACCFVDIACDASSELTEGSRQSIAKRNLDVLVCLSGVPPTGNASGLARHGVWWFSLGEPTENSGDPPYWREIVTEAPVSQIALLRSDRDFASAEIVSRHSEPTRIGWRLTETAEALTSIAGPMLIRGFLDLLANVQTGMAPIQAPASRHTNSSASGSLRFLLARAQHSWSVRTRGRSTNRWFLAMRPHGAESFWPVPKPRGSEFADPFAAEQDGRHFVFFEEVPAGSARGRISALEVLGPGECDLPFPVLEAKHHLSYPAVFKNNGEWFLLPESSASHQVSLYRAARFPDNWEHCANLVENLPVVDTTPFHLDGTWYFFTTTRAPNVETFLFYSDRLDGRWHYHPSNPVCSEAVCARGAGQLFFADGKLFRPSQDHSSGYGSGIVLNEILRLTRSEYEEWPFRTIRPDWQPGLIGTHTLNRDSLYEFVDGLRRER
ncbi:MAG: hypothetical protein WAM39_17430 [Bryobacteraceae bacterium]